MDLARGVLSGCRSYAPPLGDVGHQGGTLSLVPAAETSCEYYFRCLVEDKPGVLAAVARVLSEHAISIRSMIQKGRRGNGPVNMVMVSHQARERDVQAALAEIDRLPVIAEPTRIIRRAD